MPYFSFVLWWGSVCYGSGWGYVVAIGGVTVVQWEKSGEVTSGGMARVVAFLHSEQWREIRRLFALLSDHCFSLLLAHYGIGHVISTVPVYEMI